MGQECAPRFQLRHITMHSTALVSSVSGSVPLRGGGKAWFRRSSRNQRAGVVVPAVRDMPRNRCPLGPCFLACGIGIVLDRYVAIFPYYRSIAPALIALWLLTFLCHRTLWGRMATFLLCLVAAASFHHAWWRLYPASNLGCGLSPAGGPVAVRLTAMEASRVVDAEPDPLSGQPEGPRTLVEVRARAIRRHVRWEPASGRGGLAVDGVLQPIRPGDALEVDAWLEPPPPARNPGEFSRSQGERFRRHLYRLRADYPQAVRVTATAPAWDVRWWLPRFRAASEGRIRRLLTPAQGDIAVALILGAQEHIERDVMDAFLATGTIHLLSVSGLHVMILAASLTGLLALCGVRRRRRLIAVMVMVAVYAPLAGGRAPVIRAAVMVSVASVALLIYRERFSLNTLAAAALLVLLWNPTQLFQIGAQLSFLAMLSIVAIDVIPRRPVLEDGLKHLVRQASSFGEQLWQAVRTSVRSALWTGFWIWFLALPLVMYAFHVVSLVAVFMNLILWVPVWVAMVSGFATLLLVWFIPPLAWLVAHVLAWSVATIMAANRWGKWLTGSHFWVAGPSLVGIVLFYAVVFLPLWVSACRRHCGIVFSIAWLALLATWPRLLGLAAIQGETKGLVATFVSLGHGTCVVLEMPGGEVVAYDAGAMNNARGAADTISRFLWSRGIRRIDSLLLSHADIDHYNAVPRLLERFSVRGIVATDAMWRESSGASEYLKAALTTRRVPVTLMQAGQSISGFDPVRLHVLHPSGRSPPASDNAASLVVKVEYAGRRLLLTGDLEAEGMLALLSQAATDVDVTLAPHHGGANSRPQDFARWCDPEWVVICGARRQSQATTARYRDRDTQVLHAAVDGAVRIAITPDGRLSVAPWLPLREF